MQMQQWWQRERHTWKRNIISRSFHVTSKLAKAPPLGQTRRVLELTDALLNERIYLFLNTQRAANMKIKPQEGPTCAGVGGVRVY